MQRWRLFLMLFVALCSVSPASASQEAAWSALKAGAIVLFRHANAPGGGDPPGMKIGDCSTQRNLDEAGRDQAKRIGASFRQRGIAVGEVLASQWCRSEETARLAFGELTKAEPVFNSFFAERSKAEGQSTAAKAILSNWQNKGSLVIVTHQVNITALTGIVPASGEGVVVRIQDGRVVVVGRIAP
ncbi:MAG: histidine phosphatase family protein [Beijerinckiaceae bacterium]